MLIILSWRPKAGGIGTMAPPKYAPVRVTDVVFEVEYLCNGWVKQDGVNANLL